LEFPAGFVFDGVVVAADGAEVGGVGGSAVLVVDGVVEVAVGGGYATGGEDAGGVGGLDPAGLDGGGSTAGGAVPEDGAAVGVGEGDVPLAVLLTEGDLAGDVGHDGSPSRYVTGLLGESDQGVQSETYVDHRPGWGGDVAVVAFEQVHVYVGAELVHASGVASTVESRGDVSDPLPDRGGPVGGKVIGG
jgi:hypothetical protein